jgi:hypothetical protein
MYTRTVVVTAPSYSGLVRRPLTAVTRVRIPLGSPTRNPRKPPRVSSFQGVGRLTPTSPSGVPPPAWIPRAAPTDRRAPRRQMLVISRHGSTAGWDPDVSPTESPSQQSFPARRARLAWLRVGDRVAMSWRRHRDSATPSPAQPSPAQPSPAQPSPAQPSPKSLASTPDRRAPWVDVLAS